MKNRTAFFLVALLFLFQGTLSEASDSGNTENKKNVLLIVADDLSANALGCYGNQHCKTPHIDSIARRGMRFDNAYCQFPVCGPSRAAMMSGLYCQSIGVLGNGMSSRFTANMRNRPTMSQFFIQQGWYSARVSKIYHMRVPGDITAGVDGPDHAASWSERFNCQGPEWMSVGKHEHLTNEKLKRDPDRHYNLGFGGAFYNVKTKNGNQQPDQLAADRAIEILRRKKSEHFFLAIGLVRPHVPLVAPEKYFDMYPPETLPLPKTDAADWKDIPAKGISKNSRRIGLDSRLKKQKVLQGYYASVSFMDAQVGRILSELKRLKLDQNTIVVFKSDHGYHLGEHEFWQKMSLHEESSRIPLLIAVPGITGTDTQSVQSSSSLVEAIDLYPTLVELNQWKIPDHCQGHSLVSVLRDPEKTVRQAAFATTRKANLVRTGEYAYIQYGPKEEELYDMKKDPLQITNLAGTKESQSVLNKMRGLLQGHLDRVTNNSTPRE